MNADGQQQFVDKHNILLWCHPMQGAKFSLFGFDQISEYCNQFDRVRKFSILIHLVWFFRKRPIQTRRS